MNAPSTSGAASAFEWLGKNARVALLRPPRTKKTCTHVWPAICQAAITSASCKLAGFTTSLPCTKVSARIRARTAAACSNSSDSAACSLFAASLLQQARPLPVGEPRVGAGAQQEHLLHRRHRLVHRPGRRERPPIGAFP